MRRFLLSLIFFSNIAVAQDRPIGQWRSHLPYNTAVSVTGSGVMLYIATEYSMYSLSRGSDEVTAYSKVNGMSDIGMQQVAYDDYTGSVILAYTNSNIDIFRNEEFFNIPDLKLKTVTGTKQINDIYTENGLAYLSTDVGIMVLNLEDIEVKETYTFTANGENIPIRSFTAAGNDFYAATDRGLYKASKFSPSLQAFSEWQPLDGTRNFIASESVDNKIFVATIDTLFALESDTLRYIYSNDSMMANLVKGVTGLWIMEGNSTTFKTTALKMNTGYQLTDTININGLCDELIEYPDADTPKWIASKSDGLLKRTLKGDPFATGRPKGPGGIGNFDIVASDKEVIVAHGGYSDTYVPSYSGDGFSTYKDGEWKQYKIFSYPPFGDSVRDITHIYKGTDGTIYLGSSQSGLFILKADGSYEYYKQNSFIDPSVTGPGLYRVSGIAIDNNNVLWLTVLGGTPHELVARTADGQTYQYRVQVSRPLANAAAHLVVDDNNQKWYAAPRGGGLIVYDDNNTPETPADDRFINLQAGEGAGGLPDNEVYCIVPDKDGAIWIGTADGIGIVSCPAQVIDGNCEAEKRVVQFDQFAGFLFQGEQVRTIAVDGANRKWIGTNNGLWLISESGDEILERFTKDNSPLPSDIIQKIAIDQQTGDVYIGTEQGLISYRGTATQGGTENSDLIAYPNPVPTGYGGTIAIKGFVENADVRITDISGQLVYKTQALGGQAVWNGKDYNGRRPQSGVYLIFATNKDGTETKTGKLVFME